MKNQNELWWLFPRTVEKVGSLIRRDAGVCASSSSLPSILSKCQAFVHMFNICQADVEFAHIMTLHITYTRSRNSHTLIAIIRLESRNNQTNKNSYTNTLKSFISFIKKKIMETLLILIAFCSTSFVFLAKRKWSNSTNKKLGVFVIESYWILKWD